MQRSSTYQWDCLELMPFVGVHRVDAEGEALDQVVDEVDRALLVVALVDAQRADAGGVVDRRELVVLPVRPGARRRSG